MMRESDCSSSEDDSGSDDEDFYISEETYYLHFKPAEEKYGRNNLRWKAYDEDNQPDPNRELSRATEAGVRNQREMERLQRELNEQKVEKEYADMKKMDRMEMNQQPEEKKKLDEDVEDWQRENDFLDQESFKVISGGWTPVGFDRFNLRALW